MYAFINLNYSEHIVFHIPTKVIVQKNIHSVSKTHCLKFLLAGIILTLFCSLLYHIEVDVASLVIKQSYTLSQFLYLSFFLYRMFSGDIVRLLWSLNQFSVSILRDVVFIVSFDLEKFYTVWDSKRFPSIIKRLFISCV